MVNELSREQIHDSQTDTQIDRHTQPEGATGKKGPFDNEVK